MSKFNIGDKVVVTSKSQVYPAYTAWAKRYGLKNYDMAFSNWATESTVGEVIAHGGHLQSADYLYAITSGGKEYIVSCDGLKLVEEASSNPVIMKTQDAILYLQSLLDLAGDGVQIVIQENELFVKAFDKTFYCENVEVLEEVCKAASYLSRQETT